MASLRDSLHDDRIMWTDVWATGVFAVVSAGAAAWSGLLWPAVALDVALFVAGCVAFLYAYLRGIGRSREEAVTLAGLFFLAEGVAPRHVARALRVLLAAQVIVAVATAAARPFSSLAFGILAPMFGLAMLALWGAVHGRFPPRPAAKGPTRAATATDPAGPADEE
jgi:uncharacterized protein YfiM (DUF2279 family)